MNKKYVIVPVRKVTTSVADMCVVAWVGVERGGESSVNVVSLIYARFHLASVLSVGDVGDVSTYMCDWELGELA